MESNKVQCKICKELKTKTEAGLFPNQKTKKYVDELGVMWNGKMCGQCNRTRAQKTMEAGRLLNSNIKKLLKND